MQRKVRVLQVGALALVALGALAEPALAESAIGKNVGGEVATWAKALLLGSATLFGLPLIGRQDVKGALVLGAIVLVLGGFVFAPKTVELVINVLWTTFAG